MTVDGVSAGLGTPADKRRLRAVLRELADVVVVGAGTVRSENYGGARTDADSARRAGAIGLAAVPPIAVVTASAALLDPASSCSPTPPSRRWS